MGEVRETEGNKGGGVKVRFKVGGLYTICAKCLHFTALKGLTGHTRLEGGGGGGEATWGHVY